MESYGSIFIIITSARGISSNVREERMEKYSSIFACKSVKVCLLLIRISLFRFPIQSFFHLVAITNSTDLSSRRELAKMVEHFLSMREVVGSIPRFSNH